MSEYVPTTDQIRAVFAAGAFDEEQGERRKIAFDRWLAAHDAEVRAGVVTEEPEWEYGIKAEDDDVPLGVSPMPTLETAQTRANNIRGGWLIVRRRKAGPWVPVEQGDDVDG